MKQWLTKTVRGTALSVVLAFGIFLIATAILRGSDWSLSDIWSNSVASISEPVPRNKGEEVQNYVLFTHVTFGNQEVITGIEYASTDNRRIVLQWCYLSNSKMLGSASSSLSLAGVSKSGIKTISPFTPSSLSQFGLTKSSARALVNSHCRFEPVAKKRTNNV